MLFVAKELVWIDDKDDFRHYVPLGITIDRYIGSDFDFRHKWVLSIYFGIICIMILLNPMPKIRNKQEDDTVEKTGTGQDTSTK
jgi:hypothetical protein